MAAAWYPPELEELGEESLYAPDSSKALSVVWALYDTLSEAGGLQYDALLHIPQEHYAELSDAAREVTAARHRLTGLALRLDPRYNARSMARRDFTRAQFAIEQEHRKGAAQ